MNQLHRYKDILHELGYLKIYLTIYLKNTKKEDSIETITSSNTKKRVDFQIKKKDIEEYYEQIKSNKIGDKEGWGELELLKKILDLI